MLQPNASDLDGYMELHGSAQQLDALRDDPELQVVLYKAGLSVSGMWVADGFAEAGIARQLDYFRQALASVPQRA